MSLLTTFDPRINDWSKVPNRELCPLCCEEYFDENMIFTRTYGLVCRDCWDYSTDKKLQLEKNTTHETRQNH